MASGIKGDVVIPGMGYSKFGERRDAGAEEPMVEAYIEALGDAGVPTNHIQAAWFATAIEEQHIGNPREESSMMEVHDYSSVTEFVTMEDLSISQEGEGWKDVMDGFFDADGELPCQIDGGLKCFGHHIEASGLHMLYEIYLQLQGRTGPRQLKAPKLGLTRNLGGQPAMNVRSAAIIGTAVA